MFANDPKAEIIEEYNEIRGKIKKAPTDPGAFNDLRPWAHIKKIFSTDYDNS